MAIKQKILSLDGGGTRGIVSATILDCLFQDTGKHPIELFDLFAGTSTGGIIAVALMANIPTKTIMDLYLEQSDDIFFDSIIDKIPILRKFETLAKADYSNKKLKEILKVMLGNQTLSDLHRRHNGNKKLMVPTFDLSPNEDGHPVNFRAEVFNSFFVKYSDVSLVDLCLMTSAGPTYFPIYKNHIDGGVAINNPAMASVAFAINNNKGGDGQYCYPDGENKGLGFKTEELKVFSLGTGTSNKNFVPPQSERESNWGGAKWIGFLPDLLTESNLSVSEYYVRQVLENNQYMRIQPKFDGSDKDCPLPPASLLNHRGPIGLDEKNEEVLLEMKEYAITIYNKKKDDILAFLEVTPIST